jgi:hypothetical protein
VSSNKLDNQSVDDIKKQNMKKNRLTLVGLFVLFVLPVVIAYSAYFGGWFKAATINHGELLEEKNILDIEDFSFIRKEGSKITGKEFETLYWWLVVIQPNDCDSDCIETNLYMLNQTYQGIGKETDRINPLVIFPQSEKLTEFKTHNFPVAYSNFSNQGVMALKKTRSGLNQDLPANNIYLVDPLGNIFMRYPLIKDKKEGPALSKGLRSDLLRLLKYSRLG